MKKILYEIAISFFALIAVVFAIIDIAIGLNPILQLMDNLILLLFIIDYFFRLFKSDSKKKFIKENIPDLIAIIPFNSFFRIFRVFKLAKLTKLAKISKFFKLSRVIAYMARGMKKIGVFLDTNGFKYMLFLTFITILIGGIAISYTEHMSLPDGVWWAFVTASTVGYGDISPSSPLGRFIAVILMVVGIGLIGSLTSTITNFFLSKDHKRNVPDSVIFEIKTQIDNVQNLSDEDIDTICQILKTLNKKENGKN